jgi:hypothetical protein
MVLKHWTKVYNAQVVEVRGAIVATAPKIVAVSHAGLKREYSFDLDSGPWGEVYRAAAQLSGVASVQADGRPGAMTIEVNALKDWETVDNQVMAMILSRMPQKTEVVRNGD